MITATLYCDVCGTINRPDARFCFSCGQSLQILPLMGTVLDSNVGQLAPHHLLKLRYHILEQLGKGGMGAVYKAEDSDFGNRLVAVKVMSQHGLNPDQLVEAAKAFKHEALLLASLMHPNLPRIYDHFNDGGHWYLVMDFIEGETLEQRLHKTRAGAAQQQGLPIREVLEIGIQLCTVLGYLHTRQPAIIFRDLKPGNVMLTADGHLYLIDFGIARHFKAGQHTDTAIFGSVGYAAPEQYGKAQTTPRSDIYSLGATLHQMLSGNDPAQAAFRFAPLRLQGQPTLPELEALIMQMVELNEDKRPASMSVIKQELQRITAQRTTEPTTSVQPVGTLASPSGSPPLLVKEAPSSQTLQSRQVFPPLGTTLFTYRGHVKRVLAAAWSPDGTRIASAGDDQTVQVWSPIWENGREMAVAENAVLTYRGHSAWVKAVAWSPNGTSIASAGADTTVQVWNTTTGRNTLIYRGHPRIVTAVAWSPDGKYLASASYDQTVQVWDAFTGEEVFTYHGHNAFVNALAWSPDSHFIASASDDKTVQVWHVTGRRKILTKRHIYTYRGHAKQVLAVAWSPNGARIASGSWDNTVQIWDAVRGDNLATVGSFVAVQDHHTSWVNALAWSPNSTRIASASNDQTVQIWEASTGREIFTNRHIHTYCGHCEWVRAIAWSPDGELLASASHDQTVQLWQAS